MNPALNIELMRSQQAEVGRHELAARHLRDLEDSRRAPARRRRRRINPFYAVADGLMLLVKSNGQAARRAA